MSLEKKKSFRDIVSERFLKALEENPKEWKKGWEYSSTGRPFNIATNSLYSGVNLFWLKQQELDKGYNDPRWATFKQIQDNGWKLQKGSKGEKVEYWMPIDRKEGRSLSWNEYKNIEDKDERLDDNSERYIIRCKIFTVFNASQIEGAVEFELKQIYNDVSPDIIIEKISTGMNVLIEEFPNSRRAYYSLNEDKIHMPLHTQFKNDYAYSSTALHELGHSTGHRSRLNRKLDNSFGTESYAFEELVAEITSCFMSEYVESPMTEDFMKNHEAYVQSWANEIRNNKNYLFKAITEADKASNYMIKKGELEKIKQVDTASSKTLDENTHKMQNIKESKLYKLNTKQKDLGEEI